MVDWRERRMERRRSLSIRFARASPRGGASAKLSTPAPWVFEVNGNVQVPHTTPPDMAGPAHSPNPRLATPARGLGWAPDGYSGASLPLLIRTLCEAGGRGRSPLWSHRRARCTCRERLEGSAPCRSGHLTNDPWVFIFPASREGISG